MMARLGTTVNRSLVRDGTAILGPPIVDFFVDLMMENPQENRGRPFYPVIDDRD